jgi:hypothetical protein
MMTFKSAAAPGVLSNPTPMRKRRRARPRDGIGLQGSLDIKRWF